MRQHASIVQKLITIVVTDKAVIQKSKSRQTNLTWIDNRKAYDLMPFIWICMSGCIFLRITVPTITG